MHLCNLICIYRIKVVNLLAENVRIQDMKHLFFILICVICSVAFVGCSATANGGASQADTTETVLAATDETEQFSTPDLIRHDINNGRVKQIIVFGNADTTSVRFSTDGKERFDKATCRIKRDQNGRLTELHEGDEYDYTDYSTDYIYYCGNSCRMSGREWGLMMDGEPIGDWYACYWFYNDSTSQPAGFLTDNFWEFDYSKCAYLEFDRYGNWVKRRVTKYTYKEDAMPGEGKIYRRCVELTDRLVKAKNEKQWHDIENELLQTIQAYFTYEKETCIESRKIAYWDATSIQQQRESMIDLCGTIGNCCCEMHFSQRTGEGEFVQYMQNSNVIKRSLRQTSAAGQTLDFDAFDTNGTLVSRFSGTYSDGRYTGRVTNNKGGHVDFVMQEM